MSRQLLLFFAIIIGSALSQETSGTLEASVREPRTIKKKLCHKYGICGGGYEGDNHGGYQQGGQHGGYQGVPISIAISQSQSTANGAGGGYSNGYYPNNYQYNGGYPNHGGYNQGYGGYNHGYAGYNHGYDGYNQGYQGYRPGYLGNGQGSYNNQFNGNYYGGQHGGYGFQRPYGQLYDEQGGESHEDGEGFGFARSLAVAEAKA